MLDLSTYSTRSNFCQILPCRKLIEFSKAILHFPDIIFQILWTPIKIDKWFNLLPNIQYYKIRKTWKSLFLENNKNLFLNLPPYQTFVLSTQVEILTIQDYLSVCHYKIFWFKVSNGKCTLQHRRIYHMFKSWILLSNICTIDWQRIQNTE